MEKTIYRENQFVRTIYGGLGIIADFNGDKPETATSVNVMFEDMDEDFGTTNIELDLLRPASNDDIHKRLSEIHAEYKEYPYFIIQLNDIETLSDYHLEENDYIKHIRATNEVLNNPY